MRVMFHGKEIQLDSKIENGEKELDMSYHTDKLEDTIELTDIVKLVDIDKKEYELSQTKEFKIGEFDYE